MSSASERIFPLANLLQLHLSAHGASTLAPISHGVWLGNKFPILWHACLGFEFPHGGTSPLFWLEIMGFLLHCHFPWLQNEGPGAQTHKHAPFPWPCSGIPEWDWGHFLPAMTGQKSTPKFVQIGWFHSFGLPITGWGLSVVRRIVGRQSAFVMGRQPASSKTRTIAPGSRSQRPFFIPWGYRLIAMAVVISTGWQWQPQECPVVWQLSSRTWRLGPSGRQEQAL